MNVKVYDPTRAEYHKRDLNASCPFCNPKVIEDQNCTKFSFEHWYVLTNKHPYMDGNVMLVPKQHHEDLDTLSEVEWIEFSKAVLEIQKVLSVMFNTESFNIGINIGKDSGRSLPHLHWQIIPRSTRRQTVLDVLGDLHVITVSSQELKERLSK